MEVERNFVIHYNLDDCNNLILNCFQKRNTLPTILKKIIKVSPYYDEQVILSHILNLARERQLYFSKSQIRYAFNQFYSKTNHLEKDSYLKWLYGLQVPVKSSNAVIKRHISASNPLFLNENIQNPSKTINQSHSRLNDEVGK